MSTTTYSKGAYASTAELRTLISAARGTTPVDLVLSGGHYLDVFSGVWQRGDIAIHHGVIVGLGEAYQATQTLDVRGQWLVPGFIDAHVHIESSLMTPARFQEAVLPAGTTTAIWDPHEIANVWGVAGIEWALAASADLLLDVLVMVPSCVPSTSPELALESSGAVLHAADLAPFRAHPRVLGLAEMMNFPGLLGGDPEVLAKLTDFAAMRRDGHCPLLSGKDLNAYGVAGIHSCHESTTAAEAAEKLRKGIHVLIREGSCAKDADALLPLLNAYTSACIGLCSDDRNPADIAAEGHISAIIDKALHAGQEPVDVLRAATYAAARLYGLDDRGALAPGYIADVVALVPRLHGTWQQGMRVERVFKRGREYGSGVAPAVAAPRPTSVPARNLHLAELRRDDLCVAAGAGATGAQDVRVIGVIPRQILTRSETGKLPTQKLAVGGGPIAKDAARSSVGATGGAAANDGLPLAHRDEVLADPQQDILKIAVLERHHGTGRRSVAFVRGFGLRSGAIATSINHDAHNVICVGSSDAAMVAAVNALRAIDGGIVVVHEQDGGRYTMESLTLEIGGLMTDASPAVVAASLGRLKSLAKAAGCVLEEPFLQLSFLALPVIPDLKITDRGLVDVGRFVLTTVCQE